MELEELREKGVALRVALAWRRVADEEKVSLRLAVGTRGVADELASRTLRSSKRTSRVRSATWAGSRAWRPTKHVRLVSCSGRRDLLLTCFLVQLAAEQASQSLKSLEDRRDALAVSSQTVDSALDKAKADQRKKKSEISKVQVRRLSLLAQLPRTELCLDSPLPTPSRTILRRTSANSTRRHKPSKPPSSRPRTMEPAQLDSSASTTSRERDTLEIQIDDNDQQITIAETREEPDEDKIAERVANAEETLRRQERDLVTLQKAQVDPLNLLGAGMSDFVKATDRLEPCSTSRIRAGRRRSRRRYQDRCRRSS